MRFYVMIVLRTNQFSHLVAIIPTRRHACV